ncbi:hypothetical protein KC352_g31885, partial [Hortaea werneckii]
VGGQVLEGADGGGEGLGAEEVDVFKAGHDDVVYVCVGMFFGIGCGAVGSEMLSDLLGEAIHGERPIGVKDNDTCFSASQRLGTDSNGDETVENMRLASSASS